MDTPNSLEPGSASALEATNPDARFQVEWTPVTRADGGPALKTADEPRVDTEPACASVERPQETSGPGQGPGQAEEQRPTTTADEPVLRIVQAPTLAASDSDLPGLGSIADSSASMQRSSSPPHAGSPRDRGVAPEIAVSAEDPVGSRPPPSAASREGPRTSRFVLLAACVGLSASIGAAGGAAAVLAAGHLIGSRPVAPLVQSPPLDDIRSDIRGLKDTVAQVRTHLKSVGEAIGTLRTAVNGSASATAGQLGRIAEAVEKADRAQAEHFQAERAQAERSQAERAQAERVQAERAQAERAQAERAQAERIQAERRAAASATPPAAAAPVAAAAAAPVPPAQGPEVTGNVGPAAQAKAAPAVVEGWVVRKVRDGAALVEGRYGIIEIEPGDDLPGVGRIQDIRREDGRWVVVTPKGLILSPR